MSPNGKSPPRKPARLMPMSSHPASGPGATLRYSSRWLTNGLSLLLLCMAALTIIATLTLHEEARDLAGPAPGSELLLASQVAAELGRLADAAHDVLDESPSPSAETLRHFALRVEILTSLVSPTDDAPRSAARLMQAAPQAVEGLARIAAEVEPWYQQLHRGDAAPAQAARAAGDMLARMPGLRRLADQAASAIHIAQAQIRDDARQAMAASFKRLQWTLAGLISGSVVLALWLLVLNSQAKHLNERLAEANAKLESAVIERTRQLAWLANTDELTELRNRRAFMEAGELLLRQCRRYPQQLAALLIDIDHFKTINDRYGHHVGDQAIRRVADALTAALRETDIIGRLGGEEFAVLMPHTDRAAALHAAERLRQAVANLKIGLLSGGPLTTTISVGVAPYETGITLDNLLMHADMALYQAKNLGRNRVHFHSPDTPVPQERDLFEDPPASGMASGPGRDEPARSAGDGG